MNYRYPNITARDPLGQLRQVQGFLRQLVDSLNIQQAQTLETETTPTAAAESAGKGGNEQAAAEKSFEAMKALIIKSADIVEAYSQKISAQLNGQYVAQSDFGTYTQETAALLKAADDQIEALLKSVESIDSTTREKIAKLELDASGLNLEIQKIIEDGVTKVAGTGYSFDENGLMIYAVGSYIKNLLNNIGMYIGVYDSSGNEVKTLLKADKDGVAATDVRINNFLIVGKHARFEDYGEDRTACFWIGG